MRIFIFPTLACNLRCPDCYENGRRAVPSMSRDTWDTICARLQECGERFGECVFTGGEPTLWPLLPLAIADAKTIARRVRVISNGHNAQPFMYGEADVIQLSDYGAINRLDIQRLRQALGWRVRVQLPVHFPWSDNVYPDALPAECGCAGWSFVGERVYPCAAAAGRQEDPSYGLDEFDRMCVDDPRCRKMCRSCPVNRKVRRHHRTDHRYVEIGVWEGPGWRVPVPWLVEWVWRRLHR